MPKVCPQCHQPMDVKQVNLTEACYTCFNVECHTDIMGIPVVEYFQRSYRDIEFEMKNGQDFPNALVSFEEEVLKVNQLLSEVESLVDHKLSEELKNELKTSSCNNRQPKGSKCVSIVKELDCDQQKGQNGSDRNCGDILKTCDTCILHLNQTFSSSCISNHVTVSQFKEKAAHQYQSTSEKSNIIINEGMSGSNAVSAISHSITLDEKLPVLPTTAVDTPSGTQQCDDEAEATGLDCYTILSIGRKCVDFEPSQGKPRKFNAIMDCKDSLPTSNDQLHTLDDCLNFESETSELWKDTLSKSNLLDRSHLEGVKDVGDNCKESSDNVDKSNCKIEVNQDCNFIMNVTNTIRCYRPSRGLHRTVKVEPETKVALNENLLAKWSNGSDCFESGSLRLPPDQSVKKSDSCELFVDVGTDSQSNSISTLPAVSVEPHQSVNNLPHKSSLSKMNTRINVPIAGTAKSRIGSITDGTIIGRVNTKGRNRLSPKRNPNKVTSTLVTKTNLVIKSQTSQMASSAVSDAPKVNWKPLLGFSELKNFGGAKSSLLPPQSKPKKVPNSKKKVGGKIDSLTNVNDDIERAIAKMQQTSRASQSSEWKTLFSDILK